MSYENGIDRALAKEFYHKAIAQYDNVLIGQEEAKHAGVLAIVTGNNLVLADAPGSGKTSFAEQMYKVVDGIEQSDVAHIPHEADLAPQRVIGGSVTTSKEIVNGSGTKTETSTTQIEGILKPTTKVIWIDEISRVAPHALNAALDAIESGTVVTDTGRMSLNGLLFAISTMNPSENQQATFNIVDAVASRHSIGAIMKDGADEAELDTLIDGIAIEGWKPTDVAPVTDLKELEIIRNTAKHVVIPDKLAPLVRQLVKRSIEVMKANDIHEAHARYVRQLASNARGLATFTGSDVVGERELRDAVEFTAGARFAMKGVKTAQRGTRLYTAVQDVVKQINK